MDRNQTLKLAAMDLLRMAEALEGMDAEVSTDEVPGEEVDTTVFKCSDCDHSVPLAEINEKNKEAAGDAEIEEITDEDRVRCPECEKGIMVAVEGQEVPEADETPEAAPAVAEEAAPVQEEAPEAKPASQNSPQAHYGTPGSLEKEAGIKEVMDKARKLPQAAKQLLGDVVNQGLDNLVERTEATDVNPAMKAFQMFLYGPHGVETKTQPIDPYDQGFREAGFEMDASLSPQGLALGFLLFLGVANNVFAADQVKPGNIRHLLEMPKMEQVINANKAQLDALGQKALDSVEKSHQAIQDKNNQTSHTPDNTPEKPLDPEGTGDNQWKTASFASAIKLASEGFGW